ncbi:DUF3560 domain-containing protein [Leifsonia sp. NPDC102414]|uniref:DUF3560 domain-containing protein n=1 Tax=Leifsonia sp. NPDC102414 TaxID=3364124 RepID=UPI00381CAB57
MLTITHTHETGTLIEGTEKGDGTADALKANRWRYSRHIGWYLAGTRDHNARQHTIRTTVAALEAAGFDVETVIDDTPRATAAVEADKLARQADRVDALTAKADRKDAADTAAWEQVQAAHRSLPEGGEPIHIGHHSERRHRGAIAKADRAMRASINATQAAAHAHDRANTAAKTTELRYSPRHVATRIERIQTDIRGTERRINGSSHNFGGGYIETTAPATGDYLNRLQVQLTSQQDQLIYWQSIRAQQIEAGETSDYSRDTIHPGDLVQIGRGAATSWDRVVRANPKTVTVQPTSVPWPMKYTYGQITGHKPAPATIAAG